MARVETGASSWELRSDAFRGDGSVALRPGQSVTIGRAGGGAKVGVEADAVSGQHVRIACMRDGTLTVTDLGSTNGTALKKGWGGGRELDANAEYELVDGASLVLATQVTVTASETKEKQKAPAPARASFAASKSSAEPAAPERKSFSLFGPIQPAKADDAPAAAGARGGKVAPFRLRPRATVEEEDEEPAPRKGFSLFGAKPKAEPEYEEEEEDEEPAPRQGFSLFGAKEAPTMTTAEREALKRERQQYVQTQREYATTAGERRAPQKTAAPRAAAQPPSPAVSSTTGTEKQWVLTSDAIDGGCIALSPGAALTVGTAAGSDIQMVGDTAEGIVSGTHCSIEVTEDGRSLVVSDLDSTNGTRVKAGLFSNTEVAPGEEVFVKPGSTVLLAQSVPLTVAYAPVDEDVPVAGKAPKSRASAPGSTGFKMPSFSFGAPKAAPEAPQKEVYEEAEEEEEEDDDVQAPVVQKEQQATSMGMKGLWAATEAVGSLSAKVAQAADVEDDEDEDEEEEEEEEVPFVPALTRAEAMASIEADYKADYFVTAEGAMDAYAPDCTFSDDFSSYRGVDRFKRNVANLGNFIEEGSLNIDAELQELADGSVRSKWTFSSVLKLPWRPRLAASGTTTHVFDANNRVIEHNERWESDISAVLANLLRPANAASPEDGWERNMLALSKGDLGDLWDANEDGIALLSTPVVIASVASVAYTGAGLPGVLLGSVEGLAWLGFAGVAARKYTSSRPGRDRTLPADLADAQATLERCAASEDVAPEAVRASVALLEDALEDGSATKPEASLVDGTWYLAYTSSLETLPVLEGYMPVDERIFIDFEGEGISLVTKVLPQFIGRNAPTFTIKPGDTFKWDADAATLTFNLSGSESGGVKPIKSWKMLFASETTLVARSSGTGLNVLRRVG